MSRPEFGTLMWKISTADPTLSDADWLRYYFFAYGAVYSYEDSYFQHKSGMFGSKEFESLKKQLAFQFSLPYFRAAWQIMRPNFDVQFVDFMDGEMRHVKAVRRTVGATVRSLALKEWEAAELHR